jgi:hypothetical protein
MSEERPPDHISRKRVVYNMEGMERAVVRRDVVYRTTDEGPLTMDVYRPADAGDALRPAVVLAAGYRDAGYEKMLGCRFKDMAMTVSWAQLIAASGMIAVAYTNRDPAADLDALLQYVRSNGASLGIDSGRLAVWACSGNVPVALGALAQGHASLRCAVLLYGYMLDLDGATGVAEASAAFRFANASAGRSVEDLPREVALFVVRAGLEQFPHLNGSLDRFVEKALALNRPLTLVNHAAGPHSFDLLDNTEASRSIVRQALEFLRSQLTPAGS